MDERGTAGPHTQATTSPTTERIGLGWLLMWLPVAALVVLPFAHSYTQLSITDEFQHVDYLVKTEHLEHVNGGEKVGQVAMREQACRGIELQGATLPPCGRKHYRATDFPGAGFNHTYSDPPTYYVVTAPLSWLVQKVTGLDSVVTAARSVGVLWLAAGLAASFALALRLGAGRLAAVGATLLVATTPVVMLSTATVTTDAPELLVGALLLLTAVSVVEGRRAWWWLAPVAFAAAAVKITSLTAVGAVAVVLLLSWWGDRREGRRAEPQPVEGQPPSPRHELRALVATVGAALVPLAAWAAFSSATAFDSVDEIPMGQQFKVSGLTWAAVSDAVPRLVSPVRNPDLPSYLNGDSVRLMLALTNALLIVACLAVAWYGARRLVASRMAVATTAAMVVGAPAYLVLLYVSLSVSYWIPGRYGLSILPAAAGVLAVAAGQRRAGGPVLVGLGVVSLLVLLAETL